MANVLASSVKVAVGRVADFAASIRETHQLGHPAGSLHPWSREFFEKTIDVYLDALPWSHLKSLAVAFGEAAEAMVAMGTPLPSIERDWLLVHGFLNSASEVLLEYAPEGIECDSEFELPERSPAALRFCELAQASSPQGAIELLDAAITIRFHLTAKPPCPLNAGEQAVLELLAAGEMKADVADIVGYSERTVDRRIRSLCKKLDVGCRAEAIATAVGYGWVSL